MLALLEGESCGMGFGHVALPKLQDVRHILHALGKLDGVLQGIALGTAHITVGLLSGHTQLHNKALSKTLFYRRQGFMEQTQPVFHGTAIFVGTGVGV